MAMGFNADHGKKIDNLNVGLGQVSSQLADMSTYLNYMPINGGTFDGNENNNVMIDGGVY